MCVSEKNGSRIITPSSVKVLGKIRNYFGRYLGRLSLYFLKHYFNFVNTFILNLKKMFHFFNLTKYLSTKIFLGILTWAFFVCMCVCVCYTDYLSCCTDCETLPCGFCNLALARTHERTHTRKHVHTLTHIQALTRVRNNGQTVNRSRVKLSLRQCYITHFSQ